jgi:hypothetical protein
MNAAEIIEMIKKLSPEERAEVMTFLQDGESGATGKNFRAEEAGTERKVRYISKEKFDEIVPKIFEKHEELFRRLAQ